MVNLHLHALDEASLSGENFVAVRIGDNQKLARIAPERHFKFTSPNVQRFKYGKLELFQRVGTCNIDVDPQVGEQTLTVPINGDNSHCFHFKVELQGLEKRGKKASPEKAKSLAEKEDAKLLETIPEDKAAQQKSLSKARAAGAKYLEKHNFELRLAQAVQELMRAEPEDPATFIGEALRRSQGVVIRSPGKAIEEEALPPLQAQTKTPEKTSDLEMPIVHAGSPISKNHKEKLKMKPPAVLPPLEKPVTLPETAADDEAPPPPVEEKPVEDTKSTPPRLAPEAEKPADAEDEVRRQIDFAVAEEPAPADGKPEEPAVLPEEVPEAPQPLHVPPMPQELLQNIYKRFDAKPAAEKHAEKPKAPPEASLVGSYVKVAAPKRSSSKEDMQGWERPNTPPIIEMPSEAWETMYTQFGKKDVPAVVLDAQVVTRVDFKFDNLDYDKVMGSPEVAASLKNQVRDAIAMSLRVSPALVDVELSKGSVRVHASIRSFHSNDAEVMKKHIDATSESLLSTLEASATQIPRIMETAVDPTAGLGASGLKTIVEQCSSPSASMAGADVNMGQKVADPIEDLPEPPPEVAKPELPKEDEVAPEEPPKAPPKPELPNKAEFELEEPEAKLKSAPPMEEFKLEEEPKELKPEALGEPEPAKEELKAEAPIEEPQEDERIEVTAFKDLPSVATWMSPRLELKVETLEEPEAPKEEVKAEAATEEPQEDEPNEVTAFKDLPSVATWISPRLRGGEPSVTAQLEAPEAPKEELTPEEEAMSEPSNEDTTKGVAVADAIDISEETAMNAEPEKQEELPAQEVTIFKDLPSVASWMKLRLPGAELSVAAEPEASLELKEDVTEEPEAPKEELKGEAATEEPQEESNEVTVFEDLPELIEEPEAPKEELKGEAATEEPQEESNEVTVFEDLPELIEEPEAPKEELKAEAATEEPQEESKEVTVFKDLPSVATWMSPRLRGGEPNVNAQPEGIPEEAMPEPSKQEEAVPEAAAGTAVADAIEVSQELALTEEPMPTTELTEEVAAGSTVVPVAAAVGFTAGDPICIVSAAGSETNAIKGFGSIVLLFPLQFAHPPGTSISKLPLEDPRVKALPAEFFAFAEEVAKRAETPGKEAAPVAEDSKEQKEEAQPEEPKEELKPEPPAEEAKPELPKKEEAEPEEPQVELKSAPPQPATLETDDDAGALDMVQRLVYEPPDDTSEWEKQSFSDLASVATWISPRLRGGEPGIEEEPKPEEAQEEPFSFTFEEPEAPKAEPKPEPSAEEPQADEPTAVTEFRDMPSVATWMSPRLQPKMQEEAGGATVADAIDMEALPPPAEQEASSIQLKVSESGITVEAHISSAEVVPEVQEAAFAREPHKNLPSVSSWMMPLPRIRHRSVVPEEPKEEPKPELPKEEPKPEPLKEEARPEAVLPFSNYYSAHFAGASIIENIATSSFDAARAPKEEAKPEPQEEEPKLEEPEEETGRPAGFACLPSVGSWICSYHQAAKLQKLLTESDASRPTTAEPEPQTEEATPEAAQLQKLLEDSAASRPTTAEPEPEVAETAQDSRRPSQVEAVAQIAAEVIRVTSQPAAQAKVVQRAPPKLSAATAVSFKFENLDYDTVIASRKLTEMVEGQTVEALSYILQVPLNAIDVQLSEGSVTVDAHIFCLNPDAAVRMKNLIDEKSDVVLRAVDQCVIQIPKIADAIIDGKVGLGVAGLKASVTSVLRDETRQQELLSRLTSIRSGPPSRGSTIKSRETSRPSSRPSSGSTLHSSDVDAIVFDAFASLARRAFRPLR